MYSLPGVVGWTSTLVDLHFITYYYQIKCCSCPRCHSCKERQRKGSSSSSVDFNRTCSADVQSTPRPVDIESLDESTCLLSGDVVRYVDNQSNDIEKIENELSLEEYFDGDKHQLAQHVILVLCLAFSICLVSIIIKSYKRT